jgi:hypothetical protein
MEMDEGSLKIKVNGQYQSKNGNKRAHESGISIMNS